jgi:hypothetical protein
VFHWSSLGPALRQHLRVNPSSHSSFTAYTYRLQRLLHLCCTAGRRRRVGAEKTSDEAAATQERQQGGEAQGRIGPKNEVKICVGSVESQIVLSTSQGLYQRHRSATSLLWFSPGATFWLEHASRRKKSSAMKGRGSWGSPRAMSGWRLLALAVGASGVMAGYMSVSVNQCVASRSLDHHS